MGTVASQLTRIHDLEGSLTLNNLPSGGPAAAANTDVFLQASQSAGKRLSSVTATGFLNQDAADNNCSAADVHVGLWFWVTHFASLTDLRVVFGAGTGTPTSYDAHTFPLAEYPKLGGWVRSWVDVSRTPENTGTTGLDESVLRQVGVQVSLPAVGGTSPNVIVDAHDFTDGTAALDLTGTSGLWTDFTTADENTTNQYGVFRLVGGVYNCFARVQLGTSGTSLVFTDSNFTIIFPQQALVADTFMGVTLDLQHASTAITWTSGVMRSASTKKGDLVAVGTSGTFSATGMAFGGLRVMTLTTACTLTGCAISGSGLITAGGGSLLDCTVSSATGAVALLWDVASDPDGNLDGTTFTSAGTGHAIEFGTNTPGDPTEITLTDVTFSGYGSTGTTDAAIYNNSGKHLIINIIGGTTPTYRNGSGASTTLVTGQTQVTFTGMKDSTEVRVYDSGDGSEIAGTENATDGSANNRSFAWSDTASNVVDYVIHSVAYETIRVNGFTVPASDTSIPVQQRVDRNYENP